MSVLKSDALNENVYWLDQYADKRNICGMSLNGWKPCLSLHYWSEVQEPDYKNTDKMEAI